ncbi:MAG: NAD(P)/FAD-dependent oxidoreductase [Salibacteraceae bacterium]
MRRIVIIGNGIAGITAARNIRKKDSNVEIVVVSKETKYFFSRTALMYVFMGHMKFEHLKPYEDSFWPKNRIDLKLGVVSRILFTEKKVVFESGDSLAYDDLILALGSKPNKFGWKGQDLDGVQGLYSYQDLLLLEENVQKAKQAVIVGGGLIGVELAEMLLSRNLEVTFLIRESHFWGNVLSNEESDLIMQHMKKHGVQVKLNSSLAEIKADENNRAKEIVTEAGEVIPAQVVGLTAGVSPNVDFLKNCELKVDRGIVVNEYLQTNKDNVYAIGDCAQFEVAPIGRRNIEQVWYTGRMMGESVAETIINQPKKYNPGHWFNSAKFFDIEYQTYGKALPVLNSNQSEFYWQNENKDLAVRMVYEPDSRLFVGINVFGIRMRHNVFDAWLNDHKTVDFVVAHLNDAWFDPELYKSYLPEVQEKFNTNLIES